MLRAGPPHSAERVHEVLRALLEELQQQLGCVLVAAQRHPPLRQQRPRVQRQYRARHGDARHAVSRLQ